ncbi:MAG: MetS family NSS transporter small subunit [Lachnospirales bacterium]
MSGIAILFMIAGLCITWGGLGYALYIQFTRGKK